MDTIEEALDKIGKDQAVLHATTVMLRGSYTLNPHSFPNIKTFGAQRSMYSAIIVTKHSPLTPILRRASARIFEKGQYDRLSQYWHPDIPRGGAKLLDSMVLSTGQVFLIFGILIFALFLSTSTLVGEILYSKYKNQNDEEISKPFFKKMIDTTRAKGKELDMKNSMVQIKV